MKPSPTVSFERAGLGRPVGRPFGVVRPHDLVAVGQAEVVVERPPLDERLVGRVTDPDADRRAGERRQIDVEVLPAAAVTGQPYCRSP
jgi:hypothetical protein